MMYYYDIYSIPKFHLCPLPVLFRAEVEHHSMVIDIGSFDQESWNGVFWPHNSTRTKHAHLQDPSRHLEKLLEV